MLYVFLKTAKIEFQVVSPNRHLGKSVITGFVGLSCGAYPGCLIHQGDLHCTQHCSGWIGDFSKDSSASTLREGGGGQSCNNSQHTEAASNETRCRSEHGVLQL